MKKLFISMLAVAALASCSQEDVIVADKGDLIGFNSFVENSTRADYSTTNINTINVYGTVNNVLIYDYTPVTRPTDVANNGYGADWKCDVKQYWIADAPYKFAALVDVPKANITPDQYGMPASFTYTADGVTDVLYDYYATTGLKENNPTVPFTFKHLLSKVHFTVTNESEIDTYTYTISNVTVTNTRANGTYTVYTSNDADAVGVWSTTLTKGNTTFDPIKDVTNAKPVSNADLLLIPIPDTKVGISFTVTLSVNGKEVSTYNYAKPDVVTLEQNTIYNFGVKFTPGEVIDFTVTAQPNWNPTVGGTEVELQ